MSTYDYDEDYPSHTYVECCDRLALRANTYRWHDGATTVRLCRQGYGCTTE